MCGSHHQTTTLRPPAKVARLSEERAPIESSVNPPSERGHALLMSIDRISLMLSRSMNSKWVCKKVSLTTGWLRDSYWPTDRSLPELPIVYVSSSSCFRGLTKKVLSLRCSVVCVLEAGCAPPILGWSLAYQWRALLFRTIMSGLLWALTPETGLGGRAHKTVTAPISLELTGIH